MRSFTTIASYFSYVESYHDYLTLLMSTVHRQAGHFKDLKAIGRDMRRVVRRVHPMKRWNK